MLCPSAFVLLIPVIYEVQTVYLLKSVLSVAPERDSVTRFSLGFFRESITPRPLINALKYFRILFRIR
jgi:hypothetical protein